MLRKILFPTDGSGPAMLAAENLAELIENLSDSHVTIAIAVEPFSADTSDYDEDTVVVQNAKMRQRAQAALAATARIFENKSIRHAVKIVEGDPVSAALATEAEAGQYDVIAMGSRGLGMQKSDLHYLGSVTEHVIRRVPIPVLVIPIHKD